MYNVSDASKARPAPTLSADRVAAPGISSK